MEVTQYSAGQIATLIKLRQLLGEKHFTIFDLKRSKHRYEFVAARIDGACALESPVLVRLCNRGGKERIRIQFFYTNRWPDDLKNHVTTWTGGGCLFYPQNILPNTKGQVVPMGEDGEKETIGRARSNGVYDLE